MLGVLHLVGCGRTEAAGVSRLTLAAVEPAWLEPGGELRVIGKGLPIGRTGQLDLRGVLYRPALPPRGVALALSVRAVSHALLSVKLDQRACAALGGRGTFVGSLEVSFPEGAHGQRLVGQLAGVELDLGPPVDRELAQDDRLRDRAREMLGYLGVLVDEGAESHEGIRVSGSRPTSLAARAGLSQGDLIVEVAGVRVHTLGDLAPPPGLDVLRMRILPSGGRAAVEIALSVRGFEGPGMESALLSVAVAAVFTLLCGVLYGPLPSPTPYFARCLARVREAGGLPFLLGWDDRGLPTGVRPDDGLLRVRWTATNMLFGLVVVAGLMAAVVLEPLLEERIDALALWLAIAGLRLGVTLLFSSDGFGASARAAAGRQLGETLVVLVSIVAAFAHSGTRSLAGVVGSQGGAPWTWGVFTKPALAVAFLAFILQTSRMAPVCVPPGRLSEAIGQVLDVGARVLVCALGAVVFLGGWGLGGWGLAASGSWLPDDYGLLGAGLFAVKTWSLSGLLHAARACRFGAQGSRWRLPGLCLFSIGLSVAWVVLGIGPRASLFVGMVLFASLGCFVGIAAFSLVRPTGLGSSDVAAAPVRSRASPDCS